jgi:H+/Cl- antiporter ClcA
MKISLLGISAQSVRDSLQEHVSIGRFVLKWLLIAIPVGLVIGSACALFVSSLNSVTNYRELHPGLLFFLPLAGIAVVMLYHYFGQSVEQGSDLIVDAIHQPGGEVPRRMAPIIFIASLITHLFGGSAGREGSALQIGAGIASSFAKLFKLQPADRRLLLMAGIAGGFGAVFGTPLAGAVFALEVLAVGTLKYDGLLPCLIASVVGDITCRLWGINQVHHMIASAASMMPAKSSAIGLFRFEWFLLAKVALVAIVFGLTSRVFSEMTHGVHKLFKRVKYYWLRPVVGAVIVIGLTYALGTRDFLGLGVSSLNPHAVTIESAFVKGGVAPLSWLWKLVFTVVTLGSGFKGGEVTPMFFIGATLGNVLAVLLDAPVELFAGLGFVAVFAGAANTPLACTILSVELFGSDNLVYFAVAVFLSYIFSGHSGVYLSQRVVDSKGLTIDLPSNASLGSIRKLHSDAPES